MWWLLVGGVVLLVAGVARAETFRDAPKYTGNATWRGAGDPPASLTPRPRFKVGQSVLDSSSGKAKRKVIRELRGSKGKSGWMWDYYFTDGSISSEDVMRAEG